MKRTALTLVFSFSTAALLAHPHFNKTISAKLPSGVEVTIAYQTTPANEMQAQNVKPGEFVSPRRPTLKLSAEIKTEKQTIPAGDYAIGVIKNTEKDWTMALFPGAPARGVPIDMTKLIKLESIFETDKGAAEHMLIDLTPGHSKFEGKAVLTLHFGTLFLAGVLA